MAILNFNKIANFHVESVAAPTRPITGFTITQTVAGTSTVKEVRTIQCIAEAAGNLNFVGFSMDSALNERNFYFYFKVDGVDRDPSFSDREGQGIVIASGVTAETIAATLNSHLNTVLPTYFTSTVIGDTLTVTNYRTGECQAAVDGPDTTYDWNTMGLTHCYAVTGWCWSYDSGMGGNVGARLKKKKYYRFIINLEDFDNGLSY